MFSTWNSPVPQIVATQSFFISPRSVAEAEVTAILDKSYDIQLQML
jgi:hypothetical protein